MRLTRRSRRLLFFLTLYLAFCLIAGIYIAEGTLHPARRPLTSEDQTTMREIASHLDSDFDNVSITTADAATLRAWTIHPRRRNGDSVILLHGLGDNRLGMTGYAQLLLAHGFAFSSPTRALMAPAEATSPPTAFSNVMTFTSGSTSSPRKVTRIASTDSPNPWAPPNSCSLSLSSRAFAP